MLLININSSKMFSSLFFLGDISEATGLSLIPLPLPSFPLRDSIPSKLIEEGKLSALQLGNTLV